MANATMATATSKVYPLMSRDEVEGMIAAGRKLIIINQHILKVDAWLPYHPAGDLAILHMVGRDATDETTVLHSQAAIDQMQRYRIGRTEGRWKNFVPPIQGGKFRTQDEIEQQAQDTDSSGPEVDGRSSENSRSPSPVFDTVDNGEGVRQRKQDQAKARQAAQPAADGDGMTFLDTLTREQITLDLDKYPSQNDSTQAEIITKYRQLHQRVRDAGLYQCNYWAYARECTRYVLLFATSMLLLRHGWYMCSALALGFTWHQLVFTAHDAGHMGITHHYHVDSVIGIIIADFIGGLSMGWWKRSHNVHHIVTNSPEHDPDIEHLPFFAISHRFFGSLTSTYYNRVMKYDAFSKVVIKIQAYLYYPMLSLARFNLTFLSLDYLLAGRGPTKGPAAWHRWLELVGQVFFWTWYGYLLIYRTLPNNWTRLAYVLVSNMAASPVHVQIVQSHFAMSTADLGPQESFPQKMLRTTMDVDCPPWLDFIHGGLQFQVIHHLFPRIPRHNLRQTQSMVQEFCNEVGIPYALYGFADCNKQVIGTLAEVSRQAAILAKCQRTMIEKGEAFGHGH